MRLVIIGASGHGKVVADIARRCGYQDIVFLDSNPNLSVCGGYPVLGSEDIADELDGHLFIAIGNGRVRERLMNQFQHRFFPVLIHPNATVAGDVEIQRGGVVMAGAVINPNVKIGYGVIVNTASSIDHDCAIGDYVHIAVGARLCGTVRVGNGTWIGAGSVISNNITICSDVTIGAGAVVIRDIKTPGTYVGAPAKRLVKSIGKEGVPSPTEC